MMPSFSAREANGLKPSSAATLEGFAVCGVPFQAGLLLACLPRFYPHLKA
jgi:hypothetical protein